MSTYKAGTEIKKQGKLMAISLQKLSTKSVNNSVYKHGGKAYVV